MTKTEQWTKVQEIAKKHKFNEKVMKSLAELLEPKKGGGHSDRIVQIIDGEEYRNCRFTGKLWSLDDLVYQNDEMRKKKKDKGYSKIGISLWNKGQKHIKTLQNKLTEEILKDDPDLETVESLKNEIKEIKVKNLGNNPAWLTTFASEDQKKVLKSQPKL